MHTSSRTATKAGPSFFANFFIATKKEEKKFFFASVLTKGL